MSMKAKILTCLVLVWIASFNAMAQDFQPEPPGQEDFTMPVMQLYYVHDQQAQMPVYAIRGPVGWKLESGVRWNLQNTSVPVIIGAMLTNHETKERLQVFPDTTCYWLTGDAALNEPGAMRLGMLNIAPMEPKAALVEAVRKIYQSDIPGLQITGVRIVPGLPAALKQAGPGRIGVGLRAVFDWQGTKMEEEIYAVYVKSAATLRGEAGVTTQTTWGLTNVHGFIAPLGTLDSRRSMFTYMVRSATPNPAWVQVHLKVRQRLNAVFQQGIRDNRAARERIMAQSRALAGQNEAFRANIMARHRRAMDTTSHDRFIDSIHDVETMKDPQWGTSKHSYAKQHWTDGWGGYIHSDDVNDNPNIRSSIEWQRMHPSE